MSTGIQWTEKTWNPVAGCTRVSAGCDNCYAVGMTHRLGAMGHGKYAGLTVLNNKDERHFNGVVRCDEAALGAPLKRKKPTIWFVNSMGDLFHKDVPFEFIDKMFAVMALCPQHTFQILTKRPDRMAEWCAWKDRNGYDTKKRIEYWMAGEPQCPNPFELAWPLPNVWLGASVEDQPTAHKRIPQLFECPAAVRFLSCEPLLGAVEISEYLDKAHLEPDPVRPVDWIVGEIGWVIVGGESGPGARACDVSWIRSIVEQCGSAGVPCFVKQVGAKPVGFAQWHHEDNEGHGIDIANHRLDDCKGGDPGEWPEDLRVRESPGVVEVAS